MTAPSEGERARRAVVTGGAVRVGRAISLALGEAGWDVAVHCHGSRQAAEEVAGRIRDMGRRSPILQADLRRPEEIVGLFERLGERWDGLELLVNNAASFPRARPEEVTAEAWDRVFALNARAPFLCARAAAELMGSGGAIVNVADVAAFEAWPAHVHYAASKAALVSVTRGLARAWGPRLRVNAVAPGAVLLPEGSSPEERRAAAARSVLGRVGRPEDVARAVLYLAEADYVTGEVLAVDGGSRWSRGGGA